MIVTGIDLGGSKATMVSLRYLEDADPVLVAHHHVETHIPSRKDALTTVASRIGAACMDSDLVWIEKPLIGRGVAASMQISEMAGAVMSHIHAITVMYVDQAKWKKQVLGKGNAKKSDVQSWVKANHPSYSVHCGVNQDLYDAACIALYGCQVQRTLGDLEDLRHTYARDRA